jgi:phosphoserine aminotransferase
VPDRDALSLPRELLPSDGRFGSGPSRIPPSHLEALAATGTSLMGTSHRRPGVRGLVASLRRGLLELFGAPEGYEIILGNGGATLFWDAAAFSLIERRSQHLAFGEFSSKFASVVAAMPHLDPPDVRTAEPGSAPRPEANPAVDAYALTHNETSTGVATSIVRPDAVGLVLVDSTSAAGAIPFDPNAVDAYYFSPQKAFASDGGLFVALVSPRAVERIGRITATGRAIPSTLSLAIALENSRQDQTYNTPAIATMFLMDLEVRELLEQGGLEAAHEHCRRASGLLYDWATNHPLASPFVADPALRSPVTVTIDFDPTVDAKALASTLRANGILDVEPYRKLGRNQLRIATFPATPIEDVERLRACIDWVLERIVEG